MREIVSILIGHYGDYLNLIIELADNKLVVVKLANQYKVISNSNSNYLFQILKLHMVLFKLEMIQAINKLFYTEKK